jgi:serine/threonine protein kinase
MSRDPSPAQPKQDEATMVTERYVDPKTNQLSTRRYLKDRFLGKGGFARVYHFTNLDSNPNKHFAGKIVLKENLTKVKQRNKLENEIRIHRYLHHENIVKFEHYFEDPEHVYILLELCGNSLSDLVKK